MRCKACNKILEDKELTRKDKNGDFFDLCTDCYTVSIAAGWDLEDSGSITQDEWLTLQENYDNIYYSITKD
jgi:hypothetical protein